MPRPQKKLYQSIHAVHEMKKTLRADVKFKEVKFKEIKLAYVSSPEFQASVRHSGEYVRNC